jgi:hypothetical protein
VAKESSSVFSLAAAALVAVMGLVPVIWLMSSPIEESAGEGEVAVVESTTTVPETTVVVEPVPTLNVDELDPAVVRVLQASGYAQLAGRSSLEEELPAAVTRVLVDRGAVLTVVEEPPAAEEG